MNRRTRKLAVLLVTPPACFLAYYLGTSLAHTNTLLSSPPLKRTH